MRASSCNPMDDYCFIRAVGKGSYGEVCLARHRKEGKQYVIKKLNLQNAPRRERKAAEQEAQLLSRLKHPNIVAYKESWEGEDGLLYIVMGYCEGGDLYHKLKEQKGKLLAESQVVDWFVQIAMALQYLHEEHIMHRDLKTQNIFLTRSNIIKVGDLGIARILESQYDMASTLIGTPYYMSPELFSNKPYNYKSDVWALGCCVYEMATLKHAFNAKDMNSLVYRIIEGKLPPMPKEYSSELGELIGTMLSRQPEKRPSVKQILRKPFIKQHISLFLQATKLKAAKHRKKTSESNVNVPTGDHEHHENDKQPKEPTDHVKKQKVNKVRSPSKNKHVTASSVIPELNTPQPIKNSMDNSDVHIATISKVDIDLLPTEKKISHDDHLIPSREPQNGCVANDTDSKIAQNHFQKQDAQVKPNSSLVSKRRAFKSISLDSMEEGDDTMKLLQPVWKDGKNIFPENLDSTDKLLEPFVPISMSDGPLHTTSEKAQVDICSTFQPHNSESGPSLSRQQRNKKREQKNQNSDKFDVGNQRPLPSPPAGIHRTVRNSISNPERCSSEPSDSDYRPLSARERRRLKQSQEEIFASAPAFRRPSVNSVGDTLSCSENEQLPDLVLHEKKDSKARHLSENELNSSNSSTDKSEGDVKEGKCDTADMHDLVQLMTQTLHMEKDRSEMPLAPSCGSEFKLHRKYRDTLILHGKAEEEPQEFCFGDLPSANATAPENFKRMIEALRADVVQGLGVKLLEKVYDLMEEDNETERELQLRKHLGEKYANYSPKVRYLKLIEENSKF
ncbi:serine/threonine-protein kinase Nek4 isoform X2 [Bombina bombina]|uniref:serine/threonine-protein kinase Nek4 isoform X2 n=1 Tax=Bombina bombina TaxID=8345 RepID=UPI00235A9DC5|nr:serine/threonine-protein kinase Nek4 isoform X2 [Bombina bombina]